MAALATTGLASFGDAEEPGGPPPATWAVFWHLPGIVGLAGPRADGSFLVRRPSGSSHTVVCQGARKTTRRYPQRFAEEFAASGLEVADLAAFVAAWRAVTAPAR